MLNCHEARNATAARLLYSVAGRIREKDQVNKPSSLKVQNALSQDGNQVVLQAEEVDARIYMAAERTFLAWIRTGIAMMGFGFVIARFGLFLREINLAALTPHVPSTSYSLFIGIGLIAFGMLVNIVAVIRHRRYIAAIDRNDFRSVFGSTFAIWVALVLALIGLTMTLYLAWL